MKIIDPVPLIAIMLFGLFFTLESGVQPLLAFVFFGLVAVTIFVSIAWYQKEHPADES